MEVIGGMVRLTRRETQLLLDALCCEELGISGEKFLQMMREETLRMRFQLAKKTLRLRQLAMTLPRSWRQPPRKRVRRKVHR